MQSTDAMVREMVHERHRRRRARLVALLAAVLVVAAAAVGMGIVRASTRAPERAPDRLPAGTADDGAGLVASAGAVRVDVYLDFLCPECRRTESALAAELKALTEEGIVAVVYRPVAFLDDLSDPKGYSTRAASAAACAADQGRYEQYASVLLERQPAERGPGLGEADLVAAARDAGITDESFASCVHDGRYAPWVAYVSAVAASHQVTLTPTVLINGRRVDVTGSDPGAALDRAVREVRR
jgi:protein-disulfide isomerase